MLLKFSRRKEKLMKLTKFLKGILYTVGNLFGHASEDTSLSSQNSNTPTVNQGTTVSPTSATDDSSASENNSVNVIVNNHSNNQNCNNKQFPTLIIVTLIVAATIIVVAFISR